MQIKKHPEYAEGVCKQRLAVLLLVSVHADQTQIEFLGYHELLPNEPEATSAVSNRRLAAKTIQV